MVLGVLSAYSASYAQKTKLNLNAKNIQVKDVLNEIENQSEFFFMYDNKQIDVERKVNLEASSMNIDQVLQKLFEGTGTSFKVVNRQILLFSENQGISFSQQNGKVTGKVTDSSGNALPGVSVIVKGTANGTITDTNGNYSLSNVPENSTLQFSFVGMKGQDIAVAGKSIINVSLIDDAIGIEEVVAIGYGTVKKSDITGSISSISTEQILKVPTTDISRAIQGQATGVRVTQKSGQPGEDVLIRIRGGNSITGGNEPLFVIDGFPVTTLGSDLNPSDVESIEILKDAASTAIYGSRGANGVILITTKRGKEGKISITYDGFVGVQSLRKKLDLLGKDDFVKLANEVSRNDGGSDIYSAAEIARLPNIDWQDEVYNTASMHNHQLGFSGGSKNSRYFTSLNYLNQDGIIKNSGYERYSVRMNLDQQITEKLKFTTNLSFSNSTYAQGQYTSADGGGGIPFTTRAIPPIIPIKDQDGNYTKFTGVPWGATNSVGISNELISLQANNRLIANARFDYEIISGLHLNVNFGIDNTDGKNDYFAPPTISLGIPNGQASKSFSRSTSLLNENLLTYTKTINNTHTFSVLGGLTWQTTRVENLNGSNYNFPSPSLENNSLQSGSGNKSVSTDLIEYNLLSYLGRATYDFKSKYYLSFTGRYDGSSKFGANDKYAFFPSGAIAWRVSKEEFFQVPSVSELKLRASLGETGNQAIAPYQTLDRMGAGSIIFGGQSLTTFALSRFENASLKWETTLQLDLGLDLGLFENRVVFAADYYKKNTTNLLFNATLPPSSGFSSALRNMGEIQNNGFEIQVTSRNIVGKFSWSSVLNLYANKSKVLDLGTDSNGQPIQKVDSPIAGGNWFPLFLNEAPFQLYGYNVIGIYETDADALANGEPGKRAGDYKIEDFKKDGIIDSNDKQQLTNLDPKISFGFDNQFSYKNFELSVFIIGSLGQDIVDEFAKYNLTVNGQINVYKDVWEKRWTGPGSGGIYMQPKSTNSTNNMDANSLWVQDGSFVKFRDIKLSYNLPQSLIKSIKMSSLRLYVSTQNLITFTNYRGYDPEASWASSSVNGWDRGVYPSTKSITVGINAKF